MPKVGDVITITAYSGDSAQTKTGIIDDGSGRRFVVWKSGNSISLFFNGGDHGGNKFTTNTNGPIAEFTGTISAVSGDLSGTGGHAYFWGLYPYNSLASCNGSAITTSLPAIQMAYQEDVADNLLVTVGRSENLSIHFKNTCAIIGFKVSQENIKRVVYSSNANEPIAGEFQVSFDSNNAIVDTPTENTVGSITIKPAESSTFEPGVMYYFAVLPGVLTGGFSLTFTRTDDYVATYTRESSCEIEAGLFYTLTDKDSGLDFSPTMIPSENIVFADDKIKNKLVAAFDTNEDGEISYAEAAAVTSIEGVFGAIKTYKSFDEFQYFTSVTNIPDNMCSEWNLLTSITLPASIQSIGNNAFYKNVKLTTVQLSERLTTIGNNAFYGCSSLASVTIPESVTTIGSNAFYGCSSLANITIPEGITYLSNDIFSGCSSLASVTIPESVTSIGYNAFYGCSSLASVTIPESVTTIGSNAFYGCSSLANITIPEGITYLSNGIFSGCSSLASVTIPESVTSIGYNAFKGCSTITTITISSNVTNIGASAFASCSNLSSITIYSDVITSLGTSVGTSAFFDIANNIELEAKSLPLFSKNNFEKCFNANSISYTILDGETSISDNAFSGINMLTSVSIPGSVTNIGEYAFGSCSNLESIIIGDGVSIIGRGAFRNCTSLTSIVIPESVTFIQIEAFMNCTGLVSVTLPESISLINSYSFQGCTSLTYLTIPESVTYIQTYAFYGCIGLVSVIVPESVTEMTNAFQNCSGLSSVTIYAATPPNMSGCFNNTNNCPIYVPSSSVDAYKTSWSHLASRIEAIPE